jgi:phage repressor protein C with HTH and peptisase S24 domain
MSPTLEDGDLVLTIRPRRITSGFIYIIDHSDLGRIIKRVSDMKNGRYTLSGDNPKSTPVSLLGRVEPARITHRAVFAWTSKGFKRL